ncbi:hypothetical protein RRG08_061185 [Elysia crispata]|uniref:Uncharacterized protein n=1 Tax=Elysia crispata TaxID=231223 RepID=A0AAE0ZML5_9GAST|nr:hypothetical protein RRG08_061185 [Elysia crispata]
MFPIYGISEECRAVMSQTETTTVTVRKQRLGVFDLGQGQAKVKGTDCKKPWRQATLIRHEQFFCGGGCSKQTQPADVISIQF